MKTQKSNFSIKLIDGLSRLFFWFFAAGASLFVIVIVFNSLGLASTNVNVGIDIPTSFKVLERGSFNNGDTPIAITITEASGRIMFENAPRQFTAILLLFVVPVIAAFLYMLWLFKGFIKNVKLGNTFKAENIRHLKCIAYVIAGMWLYMQTVYAVYNFYIVPRFSFNTLQFEYSHKLFGGTLFFALFMWVLSHIFEKGAEIEEENRLTV
jgi:hypothetical protein